MDHFQQRFRRKKDAPPSPSLEKEDANNTNANANNANANANTGKTTPPPGEVVPNAAPTRPTQRRSAFRVFHRGSGKRARDSPPASLPQSPVAVMHDGVAEHPAHPPHPTHSTSSPLSGKKDHEENIMQEGLAAAAPPPSKIPAFLELSEQEIQAKFHDLAWLERNRAAISSASSNPEFRWARRPKHLDRYNNIRPWANNRVKLQVPEGHVDYINASPIELPSGAGGSDDGGREADRYIAMQGPLSLSTDHVWRMIVEQLESPGVIIMLTETHEGHVEKCFQYFPRRVEDPPLQVNRRDEFGDGFRATVHCDSIEETPAGDAIELRKLVVRVYSSRGAGARTNGAVSPAIPTSNGQSTPAPVPPLAPGDSQGESQAESEETSTSGSTDFYEMSSQESASLTTTPGAAPAAGGGAPGAEENALPVPDPDAMMDDVMQEGDSEEAPEERVVWHFLLKKWPDFGVPALEDLDSLLTLMRLSREKNASPRSPRIVHCSAGVGRSGTFIAMEHLINELEAGVLQHFDEQRPAASASPVPPSSSHSDGINSHNSSINAGSNNGVADGSNGSVVADIGGQQQQQQQQPVDQATATTAPAPGGLSVSVPALPPIKAGGGGGGGGGSGSDDLIFATVNRLREQRFAMVQASSQYLFIYKVLRKLWQDKYGHEEVGEPAAKRLEVDPFLEEQT